MKLRISIIATLTCAALAACSPPSGSSSDSEPGGSLVSSMTSMQPGQYRTTITMLEMTLPGVPAGSMPAQQPISTEHCVTSTDIADYTNNASERPGNCTQTSMNTGGGRIEGESSCEGPTGTQIMHMTGSYTSTHVEMEINSTAPMPNNAGNMTQRMSMVTDRIGECPAGAAP